MLAGGLNVVEDAHVDDYDDDCDDANVDVVDLGQGLAI